MAIIVYLCKKEDQTEHGRFCRLSVGVALCQGERRDEDVCKICYDNVPWISLDG